MDLNISVAQIVTTRKIDIGVTSSGIAYNHYAEKLLVVKVSTILNKQKYIFAKDSISVLPNARLDGQNSITESPNITEYRP